MSKFIRTFLIGMAAIALLGLGAQVHAQATDLDCSQCVDATDIASQAVTTKKIAMTISTSSNEKPCWLLFRTGISPLLPSPANRGHQGYGEVSDPRAGGAIPVRAVGRAGGAAAG